MMVPSKSQHRRGSAHKVPAMAKKLQLVAAGRRRIVFLQWSDIGYIRAGSMLRVDLLHFFLNGFSLSFLCGGGLWRVRI